MSVSKLCCSGRYPAKQQIEMCPGMAVLLNFMEFVAMEPGQALFCRVWLIFVYSAVEQIW